MERCRAIYFTQEEQDIIMQSYEEYRKTITAKSNTVAANKAREECWQKIADRVNACGSSCRTWQQVRAKHKNIIQSANRKNKEKRKTGGEPAPPESTVGSTAPEEPCLSNNEARSRVGPIIEGTEGGLGMDPSTGTQNNLLLHVVGDTMLLLPSARFPCDSTLKAEVDDQEVSVFSERPVKEEDLHHSPQPTASLSELGYEKKSFIQTTDTLGAVFKRNLELDNVKKELEIKKLKLEIELLQFKKKMQTLE
ncbi:uncharacterized protein LOC103387928 isoform X2 [Cynoglossus semilaevis]|uniref:uncharacterized protein LOC103387928 isoform X2 n=1 Tax=Cynoglossus semilaevis TaxID=244447 RepID=UPI0007DCB508|nr:uncharacterized protein LOC103387928 isoform X2 [Cynoglossus semilaevis]